MTNQTADRIGIAALLAVFLAIIFAILANVPHRINTAMAEEAVPNADPSQAPAEISAYGCGTCHTIPGVAGANGTVGPNLDRLTQQSFLAGQLANTPDNLILWIQHPQKVRPGTDMPEMGVTESAARNIAAYLYSLH